MTFGLSLGAFTALHVVISLAGIASGFVVLFGLTRGLRLDAWTAVFLATTAATSLTGFGFPFERVLPSHVVGVLSLLVLALAAVARYALQMHGRWRSVYVVSATVALYFNVFVLVVQAFQKVPALHALAPKGEEPPFAIAQGVVLVLFLALGRSAWKGFREISSPGFAKERNPWLVQS